MRSLFDHLCRFDPAEWQRAIDVLAGEIHPIDRNATLIWFAFHPLSLHLALERADDSVALGRRLGLMGDWRLSSRVDSSHRFLYAHRFWPPVKAAIAGAEARLDSLPALVAAVADGASRRARVDRDMLLGVTAVGLMTLRQAGPEAFGAAPGEIHLNPWARVRSPHQVLTDRARDDWQGLFGFTRGRRKLWTVTFDENDRDARFTLINGQEVASAAQSDRREYRSRDPRCTPGEGPIPVECRSASCGTCWVGVIAGAEKLSPVVERDEGRRMKVFGYARTDGERPLVRLACQARAYGAVSIVIPPWNGVLGKM